MRCGSWSATHGMVALDCALRSSYGPEIGRIVSGLSESNLRDRAT